MKILLISNFYYNRGGDCTYMFSLKALLEDRGHKVIIFSMLHPKNIESEWSKYFVSYINYDDQVKHIKFASGLEVLKRSIYSLEAKKKIEKLLDNEKPDIAHIQNIHHHITPSILYPLKKRNIPIVWTLHDYSIICPNTSLLSHGKICEKCRKNRYFWPALTRCKKDSLPASSVAAIETTMHRIFRMNDMVDMFIAPSDFLMNKFIEYGIDKTKLTRLYHFSTDTFKCGKLPVGDYYLYIGRISEEKGVKTLIDASIESNKGKLKIIGDGPLRSSLESYVKEKGCSAIEFLGHKSHSEVAEYIKNCSFVVMPSEWYEVFGLGILEAFACGKPAIGSRIGGIPELVEDTKRGLVFEHGDVHDLSVTIDYLLGNPDLIEEMGESARKFVEKEMNMDNYYESIMDIYNKLL